MSRFTFHRLSRADFPQLSSWLRQPHVARWWDDDPSLEALEEQYGGNVEGTEPSTVNVAHLDGRAFGLAQSYRIAAYPAHRDELARVVAFAEDASSIDYLVGRIEDTGRGLGTQMLSAFVEHVFREDAGTSVIVVPVHRHNRASWRALERVGFTRIAEGELEPDNAADTRDHVVYALTRPR